MTAEAAAETPSGRVQGRRDGRALVFAGIPFGVPARFAPPAPPVPWTGTLDAARPGPVAPQPARQVGWFTHGELPGADELGCLNLNVFTPGLDEARPVLVWVHGGGFAIGGGAASLYDGRHLAVAAGIVVVTINYRLGSLGWLCHPGLAAASGAPAGNWGLLDVLAALRWVRASITAFGGDPDRVTLGGQSAGALAALDLLVNPGAVGLFRRALLGSPPLHDVAQAADGAVRWAEALSAAAGGAAGFDAGRLRALEPERIVALHEELLDTPAFRGTRGGALPTVDTATVPVSPAAVPAARPEIDVLVGATAQEGTFFVGSPWRPAPPPERVPDVAARLARTDRPEPLLAGYRERAIVEGRDPDPVSLLVEIATDAMVAEPVARWAAGRAAGGGRVHRFRVDHRGGGPQLGATHTVDVPLLFGTWRDGSAGERLAGQPVAAGSAGVAEAARELLEAVAAFVHGGSPGWAEVPADGTPAEVGVFGGGAPFAVEHEPDPATRATSLTQSRRH